MNDVKSEFYNVRHVNNEFTRKYQGNWYYAKIRPVPNPNELLYIISDLSEGKDVRVSREYQVIHYDNCGNKFHKLDKKLLKLLDQLPSEFYNQEITLLIQSPVPQIDKGNYLYGGQPLVHIINPYINFESFPDQPHINGFIYNKIPTSLCYTDDYAFFENSSYEEKIIYAILQSTIWLFKHLLWVYLKEKQYIKPWIGPASEELPPEDMPFLLSQKTPCICGSKKEFGKCCFKKLYLKKSGVLINDSQMRVLQDNWQIHNSFEKDFREYFLHLIDKIEESV
jgi:hypothetical protein